MSRVIIDSDTGEVTGEINEGDRIVTRKQNEYVATHEINFNKDAQFVKFYTDIVPYLTKCLSASELKMVIALIPYAKYGSCTIEKTTNGYSNFLGIQGISDETGLSYDFVKRNMRTLKAKGVIGFHETGSIIPNSKSTVDRVYTINPYVFFNGKDLNSTVYKFYENSGWKEKVMKSISG